MAAFNLSDYVQVQERIDKFWKECNENEWIGFIETELLTPTDNDMYAVIKASVGYNIFPAGAPHERVVLATGIASETRTYAEQRGQKGHSVVNETSWVENCETSAIGRALANYNYATSGDERPSREEMAKVNRHEDDLASRPAQRSQPPQQQAPPAQQQVRPVGVQNPDAEITDKQANYLRGLLKERGHEPDVLAMAVYGVPIVELRRGDASELIQATVSGQFDLAQKDTSVSEQQLALDVNTPAANVEPEHTY